MRAETTKKAVGLAGTDGKSGNSLTIDPEGDFRKELHENGLQASGRLLSDGELHRFHVRGDKAGSRNGWYVFHMDGIPAGAAGSWKTGARFTWHAGGPDTLLSETDRAALQARIDGAKAGSDRKWQQKGRFEIGCFMLADCVKIGKISDVRHQGGPWRFCESELRSWDGGEK
jgi:hypothetical protein